MSSEQGDSNSNIEELMLCKNMTHLKIMPGGSETISLLQEAAVRAAREICSGAATHTSQHVCDQVPADELGQRGLHA